MRVRIRTAKGNEIHGRAPYPEMFPDPIEVRVGDDSLWYVTLGSLDELASVVAQDARADSERLGMIVSVPSPDDLDCGLVLTVWDDYLE